MDGDTPDSNGTSNNRTLPKMESNWAMDALCGITGFGCHDALPAKTDNAKTLEQIHEAADGSKSDANVQIGERVNAELKDAASYAVGQTIKKGTEVGAAKVVAGAAGAVIGGIKQFLPRVPVGNPDVMGHIFQDAKGHVNPNGIEYKNQLIKLFETVASAGANERPGLVLLEPAKARAGVQIFTQVLASGEQVWVFVRGNVIYDAGINAAGAHR